ncbi:hypothetical protein ATE49_18805 [Elizabethkingia miricola]|nr:hypothetical protein ATE49_18805 [Elizabethkingia miricola]OPB89719.1 hypothetical protein BAS06_05020 [Elizabethkingia miricola]
MVIKNIKNENPETFRIFYLKLNTTFGIYKPHGLLQAVRLFISVRFTISYHVCITFEMEII